MPSTGIGQYRGRRPRPGQPGVDPDPESLPLDDVMVCGPHQGGDRQTARLRQLPAHRQSPPPRSQLSGCADNAATERIPAPTSAPRRPRAATTRNRSPTAAPTSVPAASKAATGWAAGPQLTGQDVQSVP